MSQLVTLRIENFQIFLYDLLLRYNKKKCNLMISGGSVLRLLNSISVDLIKTDLWKIFYCDERADKNNLNYNQSLDFLKKLETKEIFPIKPFEEAPEREYERVLTEIDLCLLGIGENGHICSIWPNHSCITSTNFVESVTVNDKIPKRITVTPHFLNTKVRNLYFLIPSKEKTVKHPDKSILKYLLKDFIVILPE
ncbi:hypothetical protein NUSPORA_00955 [Nucleospora cyclopteri]